MKKDVIMKATKTTKLSLARENDIQHKKKKICACKRALQDGVHRKANKYPVAKGPIVL